MENRSHALWAGFFTIAMLCAAIFAGIWLNRDKTQRVDYQLITNKPVSGLNPQASVRYKGLTVGRVDNIVFDTEQPGQININISIDPDTPITQSTFATLDYQGVTGIAFIQLDDDGSKPSKLTTASGETPRIPLHPGFLEELERNSTVILANVELVSDRLAQFLTKANQQTMLDTFKSTKEATEHWTTVANNLQPTVQLLPALAQQTSQTMASVQALTQQATQLSQQLSGLTNQLHDANGPLNTALTSFYKLNAHIQSDTLPTITTIANDASNSMRAFNKTLNDLNEHPQHLIFGKPAPVPGPGEAGFVTPEK